MRKLYLDNIKWITVSIVVIYHVIYAFNGVTSSLILGPFHENQYQDGFQYVVYPWFMLLLFLVSGMSARFYLDKHTEKEFIKSRTRKLLVPSTIGLFVFQWILGYYNMLVAGAFESMGPIPGFVKYGIMAISGTGVLWYIQLLWLFSMLLILVRKIEKGRLLKLGAKANTLLLILAAVPAWGFANVLNTPVVIVYRFGIYGFGFFMGYFVLSNDSVMDRLEKWWLPLVTAAAGLCIAFVWVFWGQSYPDHVVLDTPLCNIYAWIASLAILSFMKKMGNFQNGFSSWMSRQSWGLYMMHYLPLIMTAYYLKRYAPNLPAFLIYLIVAVAAFAGGIIIYQIMSHIPFIRWAVCGLKMKEEK